MVTITNYFHTHRCARVENPGEGVPGVFAKIPVGRSRLSGKIAKGGPPISGFIAFFINKCIEICLRGSYIYQFPFPLCASMFILNALQLVPMTSDYIKRLSQYFVSKKLKGQTKMCFVNKKKVSYQLCL